MSAEIYPHDRLMAATILRLIPRWVTPNQITVLRICLIPAVLWLLWRQSYAIGIAMFLITAFTDAVDGSLARTRGQVTEWGMVWDPVADKLLIASTVGLLLFRDFPAGLSGLIVGIESVFLIGGCCRKLNGRTVSANGWGKIKMICQVIGVAAYLLFLATGTAPFALASYAILALAALFALISLCTHGL